MKFLYVILFVFMIILNGYSNPIDYTKSVIIRPANADIITQKAVKVFQEEVQKRTGILLPLISKWPEDSNTVIVIGLSSALEKMNLPIDKNSQNTDASEGFRLVIVANPKPYILVSGNDPRGVLYGVGKLLRILSLKQNHISATKAAEIISSPRYPVRGHQLGYRPKTNAYDAWDVATFDQYIRELAIFGANSIEIMPPRTDDDLTSPLMKVAPLDMMIKQSEIADSYGMDVWMWYPNMGIDYQHPDSIKKELEERHQIFSRLKRVDVVFVPGGDPGDLHPDILFSWLEQVADVLHTYHPKAKIWVSPQAFRPVKEWLDSFYANVNRHYPWFGGVVFGPWVKTPLPEIRAIVDADIPIRRYPDITHSISCQYPVRNWDLAWVMTHGREGYNPRPVAEKSIHNVLDEFADGSISYSEGINDDVNKFIWSDQDWNPDTPAIETLREFARLFIHPDYAEGVAQGLMALEQNWSGRLLTNTGVEVTLQQWQVMEKSAPQQVKKNYRFQMGLLRAYYDAYVRERMIFETQLESQARAVLREAKTVGSITVMDQAETILKQKNSNPVAADYKARSWQIADDLFQTIGSQTSEPKYQAMDGRGNFMDYMDTPLNDAIWILSNLDKIRSLADENNRLEEIDRFLNRTNPGPGGFYENFGTSDQTASMDVYPERDADPGSLKTPRVSFGVGLQGEEWVHTVVAKGFDGSATPLAWMNQVTTLYDTPLNLVYQELDTEAEYLLRVAYTGRFRAWIQLTADDTFLIHELFKTGKTPIMEYPIPREATMDGQLKLSWTCGEGERGAQLAEIWLIRKNP